MIDYLFQYVVSYPYLVVFLGTILDHSGVPLFIVLGGILLANNKVKIDILVLVILTSMYLTNLLLCVIGYNLRKKDNKNRNLYFNTLENKILNIGSKYYTENELFFLMFGKIIPIIGKYTPVFIGIYSKNVKKSIIICFWGDIFYLFIFLIPSFYFGELIKKESKIISIFLLGILILLFIINKLMLNKINYKK